MWWRGKTSLSCLHAIFEHKERANPLDPPQYCTTIGIECEHSIPRVSTVYCPPPLLSSKSSANARFQGWWALPVSQPQRRAAKARFCAHHHQSPWRKWLPLRNNRVRRGVMPSSPCQCHVDMVRRVRSLLCRSFSTRGGFPPHCAVPFFSTGFRHGEERCAHLMVPSLCYLKWWGGMSLLIMPSLCFSTWHDRGEYSFSSCLCAISFFITAVCKKVGTLAHQTNKDKAALD